MNDKTVRPPLLGEHASALVEAAQSQGYELGAVILLRPRSADSEQIRFDVVCVATGRPEILAAASALLEEAGYPPGTPAWAKQ